MQWFHWIEDCLRTWWDVRYCICCFIETLSLCSSFSLCQGWGTSRNFFTASSDSLFHPPLSLVFFFQSSSSPVFLTSLLTQSSHLSLGLPRLLLPCSPRNSAALFGSLPSAILSTCPAHCSLLLTSLSVKLLCTPVSSLNSTILLLSALATLAIFRTQLFSHTCNLCCCISVIARVSVQACRCHTSAHCPLVFLRFAGLPSLPQLLSTHSLRPALWRTSLSVFPSPHTAPPRYMKLSPWVSFFPSSSMSSSSLWWPMCRNSAACVW